MGIVFQILNILVVAVGIPLIVTSLIEMNKHFMAIRTLQEEFRSDIKTIQNRLMIIENSMHSLLVTGAKTIRKGKISDSSKEEEEL